MVVAVVHRLKETATDIVKVRLQTTTAYKGALDAATKIYRNEGPLAFYKVLPHLSTS